LVVALVMLMDDEHVHPFVFFGEDVRARRATDHFRLQRGNVAACPVIQVIVHLAGAP
jgi:hypothetical protein